MMHKVHLFYPISCPFALTPREMGPRARKPEPKTAKGQKSAHVFNYSTQRAQANTSLCGLCTFYNRGATRELREADWSTALQRPPLLLRGRARGEGEGGR